MHKRIAIAGVLIVLLTLSFGLSTPTTATAAKTLKCRVIKRGPHAVRVKCGTHVLLVRDHHRFVKVHGKRKFKVVRRGYRHVTLRRVVFAQVVRLSGVIESVGKPVSASSGLAKSEAAAANDGKTSTRWTADSKAYPQWWMVDLGEQKTIHGVRTSWCGRRAFQYVIETSADGATFAPVADRASNRAKGTTTDVLAASGRFVRIRVVGVSPSGASASASEVSVYAETTPTPTPTPAATPTSTPSVTPTASPTPPPSPVGVDVTSYGAQGDGVTDDTGAVLAAIAAAKGQPVYFPTGTYYLASKLLVPDGSHLAGPSGAGPGSAAWLKGAVVYGSNQTFADLKFGDLHKTGIANGSGATMTSFTGCRFRGGGGGVATAPVFFGGGDNSCSHIAFTDCDVERNLGDHQAFPGASNWNNVMWVEDVSRVNGAHMDHITFAGCHFGVSNGRLDIDRNIGSPRANVELWSDDKEGKAVRSGYHDVVFRDCIFEAADMFTLDIACAIHNGTHTDGYVKIDGCTIYGGGVTKDYWGYAINIEGVNHVTVTDCDIYPAWDSCLVTLAFGGVDCNNWRITNNRFHLDDFSHSGISARSTEPAIRLEGTAGTFKDNTIRNSTGSYWLFWLGTYYDGNSASNCDISGNHFRELRTAANSMARIHNATNCTITGNTFQTSATGFPGGAPAVSAGANTGTTITGNLLLHN